VLDYPEGSFQVFRARRLTQRSRLFSRCFLEGAEGTPLTEVFLLFEMNLMLLPALGVLWSFLGGGCCGCVWFLLVSGFFFLFFTDKRDGSAACGKYRGLRAAPLHRISPLFCP